MATEIIRVIFKNSIHTSNPCGLPRLSLICFHATRISDTDTLVYKHLWEPSSGFCMKENEIINTGVTNYTTNRCVPEHDRCYFLLPDFLNEGLW